ncbi:hypothetical protein BRADI_3g49870v3 [Brachypodium distachyon]|uniref:E3 ubiquitin-protein ligase RMA n=1 Tax=Brachypodium distachyon TaxID=15368 RepID=A0A0Q3QFF0_BRADI|nr:hypothetical protein BRADI_3g49870v3 [Brachypodium distachyon]
MDQASTAGASDKPAAATSNDSWRRSTSGDVLPATAGGGGCFDCNVCLEFAVEPVVTLCGHLYCWPCIYEWLRRRGHADDRSVSTRQPCPVCKAALTLDSFVPLYGRGGVRPKKPRPCGPAIPRRPAVHREAVEQRSAQHADTESDPSTRPPRDDAPLDVLYPPPPPLGRGMNVMHSASGGTALAALTWFSRGEVPPPYYSSPYHLAAWENRSPRLRRQHMEVERSLHLAFGVHSRRFQVVHMIKSCDHA